MGCNCKWVEIVLAVVILIFAFLEGVSGLNMWIVAIAAILLLVHALSCKSCGTCKVDTPTKSSRKKRR